MIVMPLNRRMRIPSPLDIVEGGADPWLLQKKNSVYYKRCSHYWSIYHVFIISITTLMAETIAAAISKQRHSHFGTLFPSQKTLYFKNIESRFLFFTSWTANHAITKMQIVPKTASSCPSASTPPRYGIGKTSNITQFHIRLICANRISRIKTQHKHQKGIAMAISSQQTKYGNQCSRYKCKTQNNQ